ncbi:hypothetical protein BZL29_7879 [Mycobacterium kansasii]|uniref:Uncharacterized protein n=1 Tax=Mycobacterium kansasii TaxID=1768 RepID=A0A1V3WG32_MYCKA|nr:hypothetical protein BZL29_7879 [Mycobacterium kansasii]
MLQQMQFRSFSAVETTVKAARALLASHQDPAAAAQRMAVGALVWGWRFLPAPAGSAQTAHGPIL